MFCGSNPEYTVGEIVYALRQSGARFVLADEEGEGLEGARGVYDCGD